MERSLLVLGRQPALGLAELESLYGADAVHPFGAQAALLDRAPETVAFGRLGGSIKLCRVLETYDVVDFDKVQQRLTKGRHLWRDLPEGKVTVGLSAVGFAKLSTAKLLAAGLTLKKIIRAMGHPVRLVPNKDDTQLSSAQVIHNGLTSPAGIELVLVRDTQQTVVARTVAEQDIASYTKRDRERPMRDAKVGMLPPKLAQIIINLATATTASDHTVLDPFCGTGVVLQEAALMGYAVYGSDLEERMVRYSRDNLNWLKDTLDVRFDWQLEHGDATDHRWSHVTTVAAEGYLGRPFTHAPEPAILKQTVAECNLIARKFLQNIHGQLSLDTRLCLALPAWQTAPGRFTHLPLLDDLAQLGYNRISFEHAREQDLVYARENQSVARELVVLIRK